MNYAELNKIIEEINEVLDGRRGFVSLTKARASKVGIKHDLLLACARVHSELETGTQGKIGWNAWKKAI
jgi:hypothetical protein